MMTSTGPRIIAAALTLAAPARAQVSPAPMANNAIGVDANADADFTLLFGNAANRMTVPISIGMDGPWSFVVDTGAERTVVSRELAARLRLAEGPQLHLLAMTGTTEVDSVIVPALNANKLSASSIAAPALLARNIGAVGMLGIDALQGRSVDIDFDHARMALHPSRRHFVQAGKRGDDIVVSARSLFGQLIVTDARWHGKQVSVVVDTGSSMSVGNPALLALMGRKTRPLGPLMMTSVTGDQKRVDAYLVDSFSIAGADFANLPIAFADAAPFRRFSLGDRPALMLGMDILRLFRRVRIDFTNRTIELTLPGRLSNGSIALTKE